MSTKSSVFLFFFELSLFLFAVLIWFIFFKIPDNYGLLAKGSDDRQLKMTMFRTNHKSEYNDVEKVVDELSQMKKEDEPAYSQLTGDESKIFLEEGRNLGVQTSRARSVIN